MRVRKTVRKERVRVNKGVSKYKTVGDDFGMTKKGIGRLI